MRSLKALVLLVACVGISACTGSPIFSPSDAQIANPLTIAIDSNTARAYLVNGNTKSLYTDGSFMVLDLTNPVSPALIESVSMDSFSGEIYYDSVNKLLYTPNRFTEDLARTNDRVLTVNVDESSADFLAINEFETEDDPFGIAHDPATNYIYVTSNSTDTMSYFDLNTTPALMTIDLSQQTSDGYELGYAYSTEVTILGRQAFVTNGNGGVYVLNLDKVTNPAINPVDYYIFNIHNPIGVATDGTYIYVTNVEYIEDDTVDQVLVIDPLALPATPDGSNIQLQDKTAAGVLFTTLTPGNNPQEVVSGQDYVFVSNMDDDTVTMIDIPTKTIVATIPVGDEPFGMAVYGPGGTDAYLYVCNVESNNLSVIDIAQRAVVATIQPNP